MFPCKRRCFSGVESASRSHGQVVQSRMSMSTNINKGEDLKGGGPKETLTDCRVDSERSLFIFFPSSVLLFYFAKLVSSDFHEIWIGSRCSGMAKKPRVHKRVRWAVGEHSECPVNSPRTSLLLLEFRAILESTPFPVPSMWVHRLCFAIKLPSWIFEIERF